MTFALKDDDGAARFQKHLPKSNDITLIVLKGHLLMEEEVNGLLQALLVTKSALDLTELRLHFRLQLVRSLLPPHAFDNDLDAAAKLNTLRNKLVHHLEPPKLERHIDAFLRALESPEAPRAAFEKEPYARRLKRCIAALCGKLSGARAALIATAAAKPR